MPERQRIALQLREIDGYSYEELAYEMGLSESAVTSLLSRARENFQRNYLLSILPNYIHRLADRTSNIDDLFRLVNPENPPVNLKKELNEILNRYYESVSKDWDEIRNNFFNVKDLKGIFERVDFNYDEVLLDLGTGTGFIALHFAPYVKEVIGLDINEEMLISALKKRETLGLKNVSFLQGDIENIPLYGKKFDIVFCNLVLHHLVDPVESLNKIHRFLKRQGKLIIVDFKRHKNKNLADDMKDIWLGFNPDEIKKWLTNLYFTKIEKFTLKSARKSKNFPEIFCIIATY